jgi:hypothetical protein
MMMRPMVLGDRHDLVDAHPALVAVGALLQPRAVERMPAAMSSRVKPSFSRASAGMSTQLLALLAELARQALRDDQLTEVAIA